jgi:hypothetical protein
MQAVSDKDDENLCFSPALQLMVDQADNQITLQIAEGFLDLGQLKQAAGLPTIPGDWLSRDREMRLFREGSAVYL